MMVECPKDTDKLVSHGIIPILVGFLNMALGRRGNYNGAFWNL